MNDNLYWLVGVASSVISFFIFKYAFDGRINKIFYRLFIILWPAMTLLLLPLFLSLNLYGGTLYFIIANVIFYALGFSYRKKSAHKKKPSIKESTVKKTSRPEPQGNIKQVSFEYENSKGEVSFREVDVKSYDGVYIVGFCHIRRAMRTFKIDRIKNSEVIIRDSGEIISLETWLVDL